MSIEIKEQAPQPPLSNTDLAFERTILAENRTLMAWIRTAISLISFGFTIYKFFNELSQNPAMPRHLFTPRKVGMFMISLALLSLLWGLMEHNSMMKKLRKSYPGIERSKTVWLAILVLVFGLVTFFVTLFRQ